MAVTYITSKISVYAFMRGWLLHKYEKYTNQLGGVYQIKTKITNYKRVHDVSMSFFQTMNKISKYKIDELSLVTTDFFYKKKNAKMKTLKKVN